MQDKFTKEIIGSARQFARMGLNIASSAVGYAAGLLHDVEKELKESSERLAGAGAADQPQGSDGAASATK